MSADNTAIKEAIQKAAGTFGIKIPTFIFGDVKSVDEDNRQCEVLAISGDKSVTITANLMAESNDGFLLIPANDSTVLVMYSDNTDPYVIMFSDIDKCQIIIDENNKMEASSQGFIFNGGELGGFVKLLDLVTKLNNLEEKVNSIIETFNTHVHTGVTTGPGSSAVTPTLIIGELTPTQRADIENTKIKQ